MSKLGRHERTIRLPDEEPWVLPPPQPSPERAQPAQAPAPPPKEKREPSPVRR